MARSPSGVACGRPSSRSLAQAPRRKQCCGKRPPSLLNVHRPVRPKLRLPPGCGMRPPQEGSPIRCTEIVSNQQCCLALLVHRLSACASYHLLRCLALLWSMPRMVFQMFRACTVCLVSMRQTMVSAAQVRVPPFVFSRHLPRHVWKELECFAWMWTPCRQMRCTCSHRYFLTSRAGCMTPYR